MYDFHSLSLQTLLKVARRAQLIDDSRMTDWVVILSIDDENLVMNHSNAHFFLQGLIHGSARIQRLAGIEMEEETRSTRSAPEAAFHQTLIGD